MKKKKLKVGICAICGNERELTREHIPPKGIFLKPRPNNTITVFSCEECNQGTKSDDELFRLWITTEAHPDSKLADLWKEKVIKSTFVRSPTLLNQFQYDHQKLLKEHKKNPLRTYDGNIVSDELANRCYSIDASRIENVARKIVKGLYYYHFGKVIPKNVKISISNEEIPINILRNIIINRKGIIGGEEGEFIYWFRFDNIEKFWSRWVLLFYLQNYLKVETKLIE